MTDAPSPKPGKVLVPAENLRVFAAALLQKGGLSPDHAGTTAEVFVWAAQRGVDSHGMARVPAYLDLLAKGIANPAPEIRLESSTPAAVVLDADRAPGPVALTAAAEEAVTRARTTGIAAVGVRRTVHTGAIGRYVSKIAEQGLVGLAFVAGMPNMGYTGVKGAAVATSPLAIAVPADGRAPLLLDMATATIALGKIRQAKASGTPLPEGAAATEDGTPTTDPEKAVMPLPLGGAKGSGMSLAFELLTSVLVGAPIFADFHSGDPKGRKHRQNALLIAVDPAAFGGAEPFAESVEATLAILKTLTPADGAEGVYYPGERSAAVAAERATDGIPVAPKVWKQLTEAADELGVALPALAGERARSTARVATERPHRYAKQLVSHLGRRAETTWDEERGEGRLLFQDGVGTLTAGDGALLLTVEAEGGSLERLETVVGRHLVRFGTKDELVVEWLRDGGEPGGTYRAE
ncbi:Ldh family oxidoreductase [Streptomyces sp. NPDC004538]|uniref:Ldh family oxidoreductase n=2 Tax=unclassified Streptomyces TaxID=2593676 RepID=UPI0033A49148